LAEEPVGDKGTNLWNLWWVYYALFHLHQSPLWSDFLDFPWGCDLRYHTLSLANGIIASPFTALWGPVVAYNLLFFVWTWWTGWFATLWARTFSLSRLGSGLIGWVAAFGAYRWAHQIHLNLFSTAGLFLCFYWWERFHSTQAKRDMAVFCLLWSWVALTDWYYAIFVGLYALLRGAVWGWIHRDENGFWWEGLLRAIPFLWMGLISLAYFYRPSGEGMHYPVMDSVPMQYPVFWSLDVFHLLIPPWLIQGLGLLGVQTQREFLIHPGLGFTLFTLLCLGIGWKKNSPPFEQKVTLWILMGVFLLLALGPILKCGGTMIQPWGIPLFLPAVGFEFIPLLTSIRVFTRFAYVGFLVFLILGIGHVETTLLKACWRAVVYTLLGFLLLIEARWTPLQMMQYQPASFYAFLQGPVLEYPSTPTSRSGTYLFHQTIHHQPVYAVEFSRLGRYRNEYTDAFPALTGLEQWLQPKDNLESNLLPLESFSDQISTLGIKHLVFPAAWWQTLEPDHRVQLDRFANHHALTVHVVGQEKNEPETLSNSRNW
jgi:hypothetical protein